jgi:hypothetical protein
MDMISLSPYFARLPVYGHENLCYRISCMNRTNIKQDTKTESNVLLLSRVDEDKLLAKSWFLQLFSQQI